MGCTFTVLANGNVSLCCLDYDGRHVIGRLDEGVSIRKILHSSAYQRLRHLHRSASQRPSTCAPAAQSGFSFRPRNQRVGCNNPSRRPARRVADRHAAERPTGPGGQKHGGELRSGAVRERGRTLEPQQALAIGAVSRQQLFQPSADFTEGDNGTPSTTGCAMSTTRQPALRQAVRLLLGG